MFTSSIIQTLTYFFFSLCSYFLLTINFSCLEVDRMQALGGVRVQICSVILPKVCKSNLCSTQGLMEMKIKTLSRSKCILWFESKFEPSAFSVLSPRALCSPKMRFWHKGRFSCKRLRINSILWARDLNCMLNLALSSTLECWGMDW